MATHRWLKFDGLKSGVRLDVDHPFVTAIGAVFCGWNYNIDGIDPGESFASVEYSANSYTISSPFMDAPESFADPVNTLCRLVVETAWAQLRERPEMLCLHGAAVELNGRLVVFPGTRRAGKSTFSLGMTAAGHRLFTDDFLPLVVDKDDTVQGIAQGIAPRLRLPLPVNAGVRTTLYFERQNYIQNKQYRYVVPASGDAASFGDAAPIGALVILDKTKNENPRFSKINSAEALRSLVVQNFARSMNSPAILNILGDIAAGVVAYRLTYSNIDAAVEAVEKKFPRWAGSSAMTSNYDHRPAQLQAAHEESENWRNSKLTQRPEVVVRTMGNQKFLAGNSDRDIVVLNECASGIWNLLTEPITIPEILEFLFAAFPDQNIEQLKMDTERTLQSFVDQKFVSVLGEHSDMGGQFGNSDSGNFGDLDTNQRIGANGNQ